MPGFAPAAGARTIDTVAEPSIRRTSWAQAWTGGQYSAIRIAVGGSIALAMLRGSWSDGRFDWAAPVLALAAFMVAAGVGVGARTIAALLASAVGLGDGGGMLGPAARQFIGLWLSVHVLMPRAPYGSLAASGRRNPAGGWSMPGWYPLFTIALFFGVRLFNAGHALADGNQMLAGAFLFLGVLYLFRPAALAAWALSLGLGIGLAILGTGSWSAAWLLHLLTFQPAWIAPRRSDETDTVFYDGSCALCHGAVRFLLAEDTTSRFRIAPLASETCEARIPAFERSRLPDSVVLARGQKLYVKSTAVIEILDGLGGLWWVLATMMRIVPESLRDAAYDFVASHRYRWFGRRSDACPLMPPELRGRIEA